jgi:hypothetical protein
VNGCDVACQWHPRQSAEVIWVGWLKAVALRINQTNTPIRTRINMNNPKRNGKAYRAPQTLLRLDAGLFRLRLSSQLLHNVALNLAVLWPLQTVIYQRQGDMCLNELRRFFHERF